MTRLVDFCWHKYPDEEPPKIRPLLVIYEHMSRRNGELKHEAYQITPFQTIGYKSPFGKEGYRIRYWSYIPELPDEVKNDRP